MERANELFITWILMRGDDNWQYEEYDGGYVINWAEDVPMFYVRFNGDAATFISIDENTTKHEMSEMLDSCPVNWRKELMAKGEELIKFANMK